MLADHVPVTEAINAVLLIAWVNLNSAITPRNAIICGVACGLNSKNCNRQSPSHKYNLFDYENLISSLFAQIAFNSLVLQEQQNKANGVKR